jgi:DNA-binding transcriptional MerR regulator
LGEGQRAGDSVLRRRAAGPGRIPPKLYRIGEVVEYSGVSRQTIHNYTTMGLLPERRWTTGGHRLYDESAFERLDKIAELKAQNKSLEEIRQYFASLDDQ